MNYGSMGASESEANTSVNDPMALAFGRVVLAPVTPDSYQFLYFLSTNTASWRWRYRGLIPPFEAFVQQINADVLTHFIVMRRSDGERLGYVVLYQADFRSLHAYLAAVFSQSHVGQGYGAEATLAFVQYVFAAWPFRKIYTELPAFNADGLTERATTFLTHEATLRDFHLFKGRSWDQNIYSFDRDAWGMRFDTEVRAYYGE